MEPNHSPEQTLVHKWVETWHRATGELETVRRRELESVETKEAIRQIFGGGGRRGSVEIAAGAPTSGLIEQQRWFTRLGQTHPQP